MAHDLTTPFRPAARFEGVRPINVYLLRLLYGLMFFMLGQTAWTHILSHVGAWEPSNAVAWCVWAAFATLAGLGMLRPLAMLPIILLEIFYKVLWLIVVAYPLWSQDLLRGSPAEDLASVFIWVVFPIVAVPWGYAFRRYVYSPGGPAIAAR
jgi:hypothetical protein